MDRNILRERWEAWEDFSQKERKFEPKKKKSKANIWILERKKTIHKALDCMFTNHYTHLSSSPRAHCPSSQLYFLWYSLPYTAMHSPPFNPVLFPDHIQHQLSHLPLHQNPQNLLLYYYQGFMYLNSFTSVGLPPQYAN